jgi:hypothetical protein
MLHQLCKTIPCFLHRCYYVIYLCLPLLNQVVMEDLSPELKVVDNVYLTIFIVLIDHKF